MKKNRRVIMITLDRSSDASLYEFFQAVREVQEGIQRHFERNGVPFGIEEVDVSVALLATRSGTGSTAIAHAQRISNNP